MRYSIAAIMNFNMFGMPHTGANVCGNLESDLSDEEQAEICARWIQLSTFYPLARQHLDEANKWEPYNLPIRFRNMAYDSIKERYRYQNQLYSCMFEATQSG